MGKSFSLSNILPSAMLVPQRLVSKTMNWIDSLEGESKLCQYRLLLPW